MDIKNNYKKISLLLIALIGLAMVTWAVGTHFTSNNKIKHTIKKTELQIPAYDTAIFNKFCRELQSVRSDNSIKTYSGLINVHDGVDSSNNVENLPFLIAIKGAGSYNRFGTVESILQDGISIEIAHDQKTIVVTKQQQTPPNLLDNMQKMKESFRSEYYQLSDTINRNEKVISFINNTHITCKEFSISYDTLSDRLTGMHTRLSDFEDPLNRKKDRVIDVKINKLDNKANLSLYPRIRDIIKQENGKAILAQKYEGYKLIIL